MTKEERQIAILDNLMKTGTVQVSELAAVLCVSEVTIRKDLTELEHKGKLYRSHGKAILLNPFVSSRPASGNDFSGTQENLCIGAEAAKLIELCDSIALGAGATVQALAQNIKPAGKLTVVSSSLCVTELLAAYDNVDIFQLGGQVMRNSLSVVGTSSEHTLRSCSFSKFFLGAEGIDPDFGISTSDIRRADLERVMMQASVKTIVLADSSKFGKRGFAKICNIGDVDMIITDNKIDADMRRRIEACGVKVVIAEGPSTGTVPDVNR